VDEAVDIRDIKRRCGLKKNEAGGPLENFFGDGAESAGEARRYLCW
jgi:hypothetical protein